MQLQNLQTNAKIYPNLKCTFDYYSSYSTVLGLNKACMVILAKNERTKAKMTMPYRAQWGGYVVHSPS